MIFNFNNQNSNLGGEILYAKTNGSYTSDTDTRLYVICTTGGLWDAKYEPTVTGGELNQLYFLNNYHDSWSCNTYVYEWLNSSGETITFSAALDTTAYPVTMVITK